MIDDDFVAVADVAVVVDIAFDDVNISRCLNVIDVAAKVNDDDDVAVDGNKTADDDDDDDIADIHLNFHHYLIGDDV